MPLTARMAGRTLLGLLALPAGNFRRDEVFAWMAGAGLLRQGRSAPVAAWERLSRDAGVVAGRDQWDRLLARLADELEADADADGRDPDAPAWRADRWRAVSRAGPPVAGLRPRTDRRPRPGRFGTPDVGGVGEVGSGPPRRPARRRAPPRPLADGRSNAPPNGSSAPSIAWPASARWRGRWASTSSPGRSSWSSRSTWAGSGAWARACWWPPSAWAWASISIWWWCSAWPKGSFPAPTRDDSLLPDHERAATGPDLPLRAGGVERQHRQLLAALAGAVTPGPVRAARRPSAQQGTDPVAAGSCRWPAPWPAGRGGLR